MTTMPDTATASLDEFRKLFVELDDEFHNQDRAQLDLLFSMIDRLSNPSGGNSKIDDEQYFQPERIAEIIRNFHHELPILWKLTPALANEPCLQEVWKVVADFLTQSTLLNHWRDWRESKAGGHEDSIEQHGQLVLENIRAEVASQELCEAMADCHFAELLTPGTLIPNPKTDRKRFRGARKQLFSAMLVTISGAYREAAAANSPFRPDLFWRRAQLHRRMRMIVFTKRNLMHCASVAAEFGYLTALLATKTIEPNAKIEAFFKRCWKQHHDVFTKMN